MQWLNILKFKLNYKWIFIRSGLGLEVIYFLFVVWQKSDSFFVQMESEYFRYSLRKSLLPIPKKCVCTILGDIK